MSQISTIKDTILSYKGCFVLIALFSISALSAALISQYVFGLHPCPLCIYQRIPYGIAIVISLIGFLSAYKLIASVLLTLSFLANTAIAFFHTGVERKWWAGLEGCSAPDMSGSLEDILAQIKAAPIVRCDEIPWVDPVLGLSMANWNVVFCLAAAIYICVVVRKCA